VGLVIGVKS